MNRFLFTAGMLIAGLTSLAQFKKGDQLVGTSIGSLFFNTGATDYSYVSSAGYSNYTSGIGLQIQPSLGWFKNERTVLGVTLNIQPVSQKSRFESGGTTYRKDRTSSLNLGLGGFARHYFSTDGAFLPYGQGGLNLGLSSSQSKGFNYQGYGPSGYKDSYDGKGSGGIFTNAQIQIGLTKMLSKSLGLDLFVGYGYYYNKMDSKTITLRDLGNNGTIDETLINQPTIKSTNQNVTLGVVFQVFLPGKGK